MELTIKRFDEPDERREFPFGSFQLVSLGGMTVGRASYEPGWRWSEHVEPRPARRCVRSSTWAWWSRAEWPS